MSANTVNYKKRFDVFFLSSMKYSLKGGHLLLSSHVLNLN